MTNLERIQARDRADSCYTKAAYLTRRAVEMESEAAELTREAMELEAAIAAAGIAGDFRREQ